MDCFGDSSSDDDEEDVLQRDASCGVCSFHSNTEASLLTHVRNAPNIHGPIDVLHSVDAFCNQRHWMMHIGPEKGVILKRVLNDAMNQKAATLNYADASFYFNCVELGTYCGYSSILMANEFRHASASMNCHWYTAEIEREYFTIAKEMIKMAGMDDVVSVHQISFDGHETNVVEVISNALKNKEHAETTKPVIDFLFIDHDKDAYKSDLIKFEKSGLIGKGTKVVADNVVFAQIQDYIQYVQDRQEEGILQTTTLKCRVEYCGENMNDYEDGIGKKVLFVNKGCLIIVFSTTLMHNLFHLLPSPTFTEVTDYLKDP